MFEHQKLKGRDYFDETIADALAYMHTDDRQLELLLGKIKNSTIFKEKAKSIASSVPRDLIQYWRAEQLIVDNEDQADKAILTRKEAGKLVYKIIEFLRGFGYLPPRPGLV
jgi:hypothetical protein